MSDNTAKETQALLCAREEISGVFGPGFNKKKCLVVAVQGRIVGKHMKTWCLDGTEAPEATEAEYLGGLLDNRPDPKAELAKRTNVAGQCRLQMGSFWRRVLDRRRKVQVYEATRSAKLMCAMAIP